MRAGITGILNDPVDIHHYLTIYQSYRALHNSANTILSNLHSVVDLRCYAGSQTVNLRHLVADCVLHTARQTNV